ncbi:MAG: hypothetical protein HOG70_03735 [Elusimicrobiaceae bacterium]|nr:hypothetical protein [Elusimicrobiaceae bacterium]
MNKIMQKLRVLMAMMFFTFIFASSMPVSATQNMNFIEYFDAQLEMMTPQDIQQVIEKGNEILANEIIRIKKEKPAYENMSLVEMRNTLQANLKKWEKDSIISIYYDENGKIDHIEPTPKFLEISGIDPDVIKNRKMGIIGFLVANGAIIGTMIFTVAGGAGLGLYLLNLFFYGGFTCYAINGIKAEKITERYSIDTCNCFEDIKSIIENNPLAVLSLDDSMLNEIDYNNNNNNNNKMRQMLRDITILMIEITSLNPEEEIIKIAELFVNIDDKNNIKNEVFKGIEEENVLEKKIKEILNLN